MHGDIAGEKRGQFIYEGTVAGRIDEGLVRGAIGPF
jgi:hypothetical protein